jgi:hypothetical protein
MLYTRAKDHTAGRVTPAHLQKHIPEKKWIYSFPLSSGGLMSLKSKYIEAAEANWNKPAPKKGKDKLTNL